MADFRDHALLGRTGLKVSRLGLASGYGLPGAGVERAYREFGVNFFYWGSVRRDDFGRGIRELAWTEREKIVVALQSYDRLGWFMDRSVAKGLKRLGTDYADVLILGWHNRYPGRGVIEAALRLREEGKVRFIALSGHRRANFPEVAGRADSPVDIFMIRYNAVHRGAEREVFPLLPRADRPGIMVYTATAWGKLLDPKRMPPGVRPLTAAECYRFVLSNPDVDLCMTGPKSIAEMEGGMSALGAGPLDPEGMTRIRRIGDHVYGKPRP